MTGSDRAPGPAVRNFVVGRWLESFRLVLLLAIGPTLVGLALATARRAPQYEPQSTQNASGVRVITSYVLIPPAIPYAGEVLLGQRLMFAAVWIITLLTHGAIAIGVGLRVGVAIGWARRALAVVVGLTVVLALAMWSFVMSAHSLLDILIARTSFTVQETLMDALFWDAVVSVFAVVFLWGTLVACGRRLSDVYREKGNALGDQKHHNNLAL